MIRKFLTILSILLISASAVADAPGGLMLTPTRVVFEGKARSTTINLINQSTRETTYRISFKNMTLNDEGKYEDIKEPIKGEKFADNMIRYSPRQVTLKPKEVQNVRLLLRKPAGLEEGEYRSHLLFSGVPPKDFGHDIESQPTDKIEIKLIPVYGISIPVIVRHGEVTAEASISDVKLEDDILKFQIGRTGNSSIYGDLEVIHQIGDKSHILAHQKGVGIFTPYPARTMQIPIKNKEIDLDEGQIIIKYLSKDNEILASIHKEL